MKYTYIAVTIEENGKYYPYALKCSTNDNLLHKLQIKGILHANICETKKAACNLVDSWRESYIRNGTYLFQDAPLF